MQLLDETTNPRGADACARELLDAVPPAMWFIRRQMRSYRKGLSVPQFRALVMVNRQPSASLSAVADHLGASLPTASRIVAGLVARGLLTRQDCATDRRQVSLAITPRGHEVLNGAWLGTQGRLAEELGALGPAECEALTGAMRTLKAIFGSLGLPGGAGVDAGTSVEAAAPRKPLRRKARVARA